jgi:hypothetical protein
VSNVHRVHDFETLNLLITLNRVIGDSHRTLPVTMLSLDSEFIWYKQKELQIIKLVMSLHK